MLKTLQLLNKVFLKMLYFQDNRLYQLNGFMCVRACVRACVRVCVYSRELMQQNMKNKENMKNKDDIKELRNFNYYSKYVS